MQGTEKLGEAREVAVATASGRHGLLLLRTGFPWLVAPLEAISLLLAAEPSPNRPRPLGWGSQASLYPFTSSLGLLGHLTPGPEALLLSISGI